jgi:hypothetical protein
VVLVFVSVVVEELLETPVLALLLLAESTLLLSVEWTDVVEPWLVEVLFPVTVLELVFVLVLTPPLRLFVLVVFRLLLLVA